MDKLVFSLYVMVIGLVIVFVVLVILILLSSLTKYANLIPSWKDIKEKRKAKKQAAKALEATPVSAPETVKPVCANADMDESELQAVIAAAIAAYLADSSAPVSPNGIVVRSVRRTSALNTASRYERMNNRI